MSSFIKQLGRRVSSLETTAREFRSSLLDIQGSLAAKEIKAGQKAKAEADKAEADKAEADKAERTEAKVKFLTESLKGLLEAGAEAEKAELERMKVETELLGADFIKAQILRKQEQTEKAQKWALEKIDLLAPVATSLVELGQAFVEKRCAEVRAPEIPTGEEQLQAKIALRRLERAEELEELEHRLSVERLKARANTTTDTPDATDDDVVIIP